MNLIAYKDFRAQMRQRLWPTPPGEPRNLRANHDGFFNDAMHEMSKTISCLQVNNTSVYPFCATHVECGKTIIEAPVGIIQRVYTIAHADWCDKVRYWRAGFAETEAWARNLSVRFTTPANTGLKALQQGYKFAEATTDIEFGRARCGQYSLYRGRIYLVPWIQSSESVVVEWDGVKQEWGDEDQLDLEKWDRHVRAAIESFVSYHHELHYGCDRQKRRDLEEKFEKDRARALYECEKRTREREEEMAHDVVARNPTKAEIDDDEPVTPEEQVVFANIGDYGDPSNAPQPAEVAELVTGWSPDFIVTNGDNLYVNGTTYASSVGALYGDYITDDLMTNRFWPSIGNHDHNNPPNGIQDYFDFFTLPNNERYYDFVKGPVHFFILHSGIQGNDQDNTEEADGILSTSKQAEWLKVRLALSTAKWKIVVVHDAPYTNGTGNSPGYSYLRWPFKTWGADLVLSGDSHGYERLEVDDFPYIVNGAGGTPLSTFIGAPTAESQLRYNDDNGAGRCTVNQTTLLYEFFNTDGDLIDSLELTK